MMDYSSLRSCLRRRPSVLARGPVMVLMAEDETVLAETVAHHLACGFRAIVLLGPAGLTVAADPRVLRIQHERDDGPLHDAVTAVARALRPGTWIGYGFNSEFLYFPHCGTRHVAEMLAFHGEERRDAMTGMVVDLYAPDLKKHPDAVDFASAHLDARGYYGLSREDPEADYKALDRQVDLYGGLRWRFEEHVPWQKRRIDRVMLFRAQRNVTLRSDFTLDRQTMNEFQCAWHHNMTCAMASFRTAKALMLSPGARASIDSFMWPGSEPFDWSDQALMDRGFIEPGQWF